MFLGTYTPRLDEKFRLILPAKFRLEVAEGLVVTKGQDRCLVIFPAAAFVERAAELHAAERAAATPEERRTTRMSVRKFSGSASDETPDRQGRITIPPTLRDYAGLDREVVVVGAYNRIELWDLLTWTTYENASDDEYAEVAPVP